MIGRENILDTNVTYWFLLGVSNILTYATNTMPKVSLDSCRIKKKYNISHVHKLINLILTYR